jgi:hypothetical protein
LAGKTFRINPIPASNAVYANFCFATALVSLLRVFTLDWFMYPHVKLIWKKNFLKNSVLSPALPEKAMPDMETVSSSFFPPKRKVLLETNAPRPTPKFVETANLSFFPTEYT